MLEFFAMALRNMRRRALRSLLTTTGLAIFVLIFIMIQSATLTMQGSITESMSDLGGEISVWSRSALLPFFYSVPENYTDIIGQIEYVKNVSPQIVGVSQIDTEDLRLALGLYPSDIPIFYTYTMIEGSMIDKNETQAAVGYLFADFLKKHVDDNITINEYTFQVVGIFRTDTWIDNAVIIPYKVAQNIYSLSGRASTIMVAATDPNKIDYIIDEIENRLENVSVFKSQEAPSRLSPIMNSLTWFTYALFTITAVACFFGLTNITVTGILERTREIGILKALGAKGRDVTKMIMYESAVLGAFGGVLGSAISLILLVEGLLVPITSTSSLRISVFPEVFLNGMILAVAISILATLYPVWRAVRVRPNEVLKFG